MTVPTPLENMLLFGGSAHPELSQEIADTLGITVSPISISKFSNDNLEVQLGVSVRRKHVFILQPLVPPTSDNLLELLMMLDIARTSGHRRFMPSFPIILMRDPTKKTHLVSRSQGA